MSKRGLEILALMTLAVGAVCILLIQDDPASSTPPVDDRRRAPTGRCPACNSFVKRPGQGEAFQCGRCEARLYQETADIVVELN